MAMYLSILNQASEYRLWEGLGEGVKAIIGVRVSGRLAQCVKVVVGCEGLWKRLSLMFGIVLAKYLLILNLA